MIIPLFVFSPNFVSWLRSDYFIIPTEDELQQIFDVSGMTYSNGRPIFFPIYSSAISLIVNTGLRAGEVLALTWEKVDFENRKMRIDSSLSEVVNREDNTRRLNYVITDTKTKNGIRTVYLNQKAIDALQQIKAYQEEHNFKSAMVICNSSGLSANYHDLQRAFANMVKKAGVKQMGLHVLRHYFASLALAKGADVKALSKMLGHGNVTVTMNIYGHLMEKQNVEFQRLLEAM